MKCKRADREPAVKRRLIWEINGGYTMKLNRILTKLYIIPIFILLAITFVYSIRKSTYFEVNLENETPSYMYDPIGIMLAALAFSVGIFLCLYHFVLKKRGNRAVLRILGITWGILLSFLAIYIYRCGVSSDALHVNRFALEFLNGNYDIFNTDSYLKIYPYQAYMASYFELIYSIFGINNFIAAQIINVIFIGLMLWGLQLIASEVFEQEGVDRLLPIVSMLYIPLYLYSTLIYGDIPGLSLGIWAIYFVVRYLKTNRWQFNIPVAILFCLAVMVKENSKILIIAYGLIMLLKIFEDRKWTRLLLAALVVCISLSGTAVMKQVYMNKAGLEEFPTGTPTLSWVVMGIQDSDESSHGCGWYNGYTISVYQESDYNYDVANEKCKQAIAEAAKEHLSNPGHAAYYYIKKWMSSWNDPEFMIQQLTEWNSRHSENKIPLSDEFIYGQGRTILFWIMNLAHMVVLLFAAVGTFGIIRHWSLPKAYILLNVCGGMVFHEFVWETSGRYIHPYYVLLMPVAGYGCYLLCSFGEEIQKRAKIS